MAAVRAFGPNRRELSLLTMQVSPSAYPPHEVTPLNNKITTRGEPNVRTFRASSRTHFYLFIMAPVITPDAKLIESLPLEWLKTMPALPPPPGVTANFADPPSTVPATIGVGTAFLALALFCFSIRIYTNFFVTKKWNWDDCRSHQEPSQSMLTGRNSNLHAGLCM
jgi:hypothetical protein